MAARENGARIALKYKGVFIHQYIERVVFYGATIKNRSAYPEAFGFVNYQGSVFPVYCDKKKSLFLEQTDPPIKMAPLSTWGSRY